MNKVHFLKFYETANTLISYLNKNMLIPISFNEEYYFYQLNFKKNQFSTLPAAYKIIIVIFHYCETSFMCVILP